MSEKDTLIQKIAAAKAELKTAGPIHRRDLQKHIRRMEIALKRCGKRRFRKCESTPRVIMPVST